MGKDGGALTPKAIANRIKAKGLQKLRWFCQMCQKQCRDENGFKCHCMSESHQRQMQLFASNPNSFMDEFSVEFERGMMEIVSRRARARINANLVYQEYISDRTHVHMNSTMWETLTDFVIYLGRSGKCEVDQTEKGWFIKYIDRDPAKLAAEEARSKRAASELDAEERHTRELLRLAKRVREEDGATEGPDGGPEPAQRELVRDADAPPLVLQLAGGGTAAGASKRTLVGGAVGAGPSGLQPQRPKVVAAASVFGAADDEEGGLRGSCAGAGGSSCTAPKSAMAAIMEEETRRKASASAAAAASAAASAAAAEAAAAAAAPKGGGARHEDWLSCGIVVKVLNGKLAGGKYRKQKGVVRVLPSRFVAQVEMLQSGDVLSLDQDDLETVLPPIGGALRVVNGAWRGVRAKLLAIDEARFCVRIELAEGAHRGQILDGIEYEDVCKLHVASPS